MTHCGRGDEYIVGQSAHTYRYEAGGAAVLGSVQPQPLEHQADGSLALATSPPRSSRTTRTSRAAGCSASRTRSAARCCRSTTWPRRPRWRANAGSATHLDGARLFNAAVALGGDPYANARAIAAHFDSVSVCFSKGLGAPVGSALVGSRAFIEQAHRWRKMLGGGMRQAGVLAAAALHALEHHVDGWPSTTRSPAGSPKGCSRFAA
jgi:threonine aldolase